MSWPSKCSLPFRVFHQNPVSISLLHHTRVSHAPPPPPLGTYLTKTTNHEITHLCYCKTPECPAAGKTCTAVFCYDPDDGSSICPRNVDKHVRVYIYTVLVFAVVSRNPCQCKCVACRTIPLPPVCVVTKFPAHSVSSLMS